MKKILSLLFCLLAFPAVAEPLTNYEAVEILGKGTAVMQRWSSKYCTTWKAQDKVFVTAAHCRGTVSSSVQIKQSTNYGYTYVKSIVLPVSTEKSNGKDEDWMIMNTEETMDEMVALPIGCGDGVKIGEQVAIGHYPAGLNFSVSFGTVMTLDITSSRNRAVIATDAAGAPGSSGAPVISMETGRVIGIVTEGLVSRFGSFAMGLEDINIIDLCENLVDDPEVMKQAYDF